MATDPELPITLQPRPWTKAMALAIGGLVCWYGTVVFGQDGNVPTPFFVRMPAGLVGGFFFALGLIIVIAGVQSIVAGKPSLVLDADGFVFTPAFGAVRRVAWRDVVAYSVYTVRRTGGVQVQTIEDKTISIPAYSGTGEDLKYLMRRCADLGAQRR